MLDERIKHFLQYCKISNFSKKSIETFTIRPNEFKKFLKQFNVGTPTDISYQYLRKFVTEYEKPFLKLNGWANLEKTELSQKAQPL